MSIFSNTILCMLIIVTCNVYPQSSITYLKRSKLPAGVDWKQFAPVKSKLYLIGTKGEKVLLYSVSDNKVRDISGLFSSNRVAIFKDKFIETTDKYQKTIYSFEGKRLISINYPITYGNASGVICWGKENDYFFRYSFHSTNFYGNPGIIRLKDNKIIFEYEAWGLGYGMPFFLFLEDYFLVNDKSTYEIKFYDYNGKYLRSIKHPTYKPVEYNSEERKSFYPQVAEKFKDKPFFPQVIDNFYYIDGEIIAATRRRPGRNTENYDVFDFATGQLKRSYIFTKPDGLIPVTDIIHDNKLYKCYYKNKISYLYVYKI